MLRLFSKLAQRNTTRFTKPTTPSRTFYNAPPDPINPHAWVTAGLSLSLFIHIARSVKKEREKSLQINNLTGRLQSVEHKLKVKQCEEAIRLLDEVAAFKPRR